MVVLGIDPGKTGALAFLETADLHIVDVQIMADMPIIIGVIQEWKPGHVFIEKAQAMPRQGVVSMFHYGEHYGELKGMIQTLQIPYSEVRPVTWKKQQLYDMPKEKKSAVHRVNQLYPELRLKDSQHGIADAILIARYGILNGGWR